MTYLRLSPRGRHSKVKISRDFAVGRARRWSSCVAVTNVPSHATTNSTDITTLECIRRISEALHDLPVIIAGRLDGTLAQPRGRHTRSCKVISLTGVLAIPCERRIIKLEGLILTRYQSGHDRRWVTPPQSYIGDRPQFLRIRRRAGSCLHGSGTAYFEPVYHHVIPPSPHPADPSLHDPESISPAYFSASHLLHHLFVSP